MKRLAGFKLPYVDTAPTPARVALRVAFAIACTAAGLWVVALLQPLLSRPHFFPAFGAIVLTAVLTGARYGVLTTVLFAVGYVFQYLEPRGVLALHDRQQQLAIVFYAITGCFVAAVGGALRSTYADARDQHRLLAISYQQREDLLRGLTHDIRTPLSAIAMTAKVLSRTYGEGSPDIQRRSELIANNVAAVEAMLRDLVEVAALEAGRIRLQRVPVDLATVIARVKDALPVGAQERVNVNVRVGQLPRLEADPQRLERVLVNLITNALKYTLGVVTVGARVDGGRVVLSVRDEGPGIGPEDLPHVFDKYYRAKGTGSKDGLGLGLYISRLLVEAHAGRIWAESEQGSGCTFNVALPLELRRPPQPVAYPTPPVA
jgi:signal transduction histidine kinase